jgi:hypothetical protein
MFRMKHLLLRVYQVCANKSPLVKLALQRWGVGGGSGGGYIQVSDLRAIMALLLLFIVQCISQINGWNSIKLHTMVKGSEMKCSAQEP